jgi:DNA polymerase-3 subunit delta'
VWLLCAPTLTDVLPTIRSRCRHLTLRTPSIQAVTKLLIERDGIDPKLASFAASAAQGHIGRAKYLATNEEARKTREKILDIPFTVTDLESAFEAANTLLELAKEQAKGESEIRDEEELAKLKESYGTTGSRLATGGSKAVKELEKEQKTRNVRLIRDFLDSTLLNIVNIEISNFKANGLDDLNKLDLEYFNQIFKLRKDLFSNGSPALVLEALFSAKLLYKN